MGSEGAEDAGLDFCHESAPHFPHGKSPTLKELERRKGRGPPNPFDWGWVFKCSPYLYSSRSSREA
jgi:hypothetical protein